MTLYCLSKNAALCQLSDLLTTNTRAFVYLKVVDSKFCFRIISTEIKSAIIYQKNNKTMFNLFLRTKLVPALFMVLITSANVFAQSPIGKHLAKPGRKNLLEIHNEMMDYFEKEKAKEPQKRSKSKRITENRDDDFAKYMRWYHYWRAEVDNEGYFVDQNPALHQKMKDGIKTSNDFTWENLSHTSNLGHQIGIGRTLALDFHPKDTNTFYVGSASGGIWKTLDGGNSYEPLGEFDLPTLAISSIVIDKEHPDTIYIGTGGDRWYDGVSRGVYKSTDGGNSWNPTALQFAVTDYMSIRWMAADPNDPATMLVCTNVGVYRTADGFATVEKVVEQGLANHVLFKPASSDTVYLTKYNGSTSDSTNTNREFWRSTDGGRTFQFSSILNTPSQTASSWSNRMFIEVSGQNPNKVFVKTDASIFVSDNAGETFGAPIPIEATFEVFPEDFFRGMFRLNPMNDSEVIAGWFHIFRFNLSADSASNYTPLFWWLGDLWPIHNDLPVVHVDQMNTFVNPMQKNLIYICNDGGVYTLDLNTNQFKDRSNGLKITQYYEIANSETNPRMIMGGAQDNGNLIREAFGEDEPFWTFSGQTGDAMDQAIDPTNDDIRYFTFQFGDLVRWHRTNFEFVYTIDFLPADFVGPFWSKFRLDPNDPKTVVLLGNRVFRSTNRGDSWEAISPYLIDNTTALDEMAIAPSNSERIYAVDIGTRSVWTPGDTKKTSVIYVKNTTDNEWVSHEFIHPNLITEIIVHPDDENHIYVSLSGYDEGRKVFESMDAGATWQNISANLPNFPVLCIEYYEGTSGGQPSALFVGTDDGVYYRLEDSTDWLRAGELPPVRITDIAIQKSENLLRVGTHGRSIFESKINFNPNALVVSEVVTEQVTCGDTCNGSATVSASGGTPPYTYEWMTNPVQTGETGFNLCTGINEVVVTDAQGVKQSRKVFIRQPLEDSDFDGTPDCQDGCPDDSSTTTPPCNVVSAVHYHQPTFSAQIYPNPTHNDLSVHIDGKSTFVTYHFTNVSGKILKKGYLYAGHNKIDLKFDSGVYLLHLFSDTEDRMVHKVLLE